MPNESNLLIFPEKNSKGVGGKLIVRPKDRPQLDAAYSLDEIKEIMVGCRDLISDIAQCPAEVVGEPSVVVARLGDDVLSAIRASGDGIPVWLRTIEMVIAIQPIQTTFGAIHLLVLAVLEGEDDNQSASPQRAFAGQNPELLESGSSTQLAWVKKFRSDMQLVAKLLSHLTRINSGLPFDGVQWKLPICWQPVFLAQGGDIVAYYEATIFDVDERGQRVFLEEEFEAIERLGFARIIDYLVMNAIINELAKDPDAKISVKISSQSLNWDIFWEEIIRRIDDEKSLGSRLIVTITFRTFIADISEARHVLEALGRVGCRVGVDNFGAGFASVRQLLALKPDLVKIEGQFLHRAFTSLRDKHLLLGLVEICRSICDSVVLCGIDDERLVQFAVDCGATLLQGHALAGVSNYRPRAAKLSSLPPIYNSGGGNVI